MNDFAQLDNEIVAAIKRGVGKFYLIEAAVAPTLDALFGSRKTDAFRTVDRRLQALRKRGAIEYRKGSWSVRTSGRS